MITSFGKFCRKIRIDEDETQEQMASKLGVSKEFLSMVENGKKKPPYNWYSLINQIYHLSKEQYSELYDFAWKEYKIFTNKLRIDVEGAEMLIDLIDKHKYEFSDKDKEKIKKLLEGETQI